MTVDCKFTLGTAFFLFTVFAAGSGFACSSDGSASGVGAATSSESTAGADGAIIKKINTYSIKSYGLMRQLLASSGIIAP